MRTQSCEQTRDRVCKVTADKEYWFKMHKGDVSKEYPLRMYSRYEHGILRSYVQSYFEQGVPSSGVQSL